MIARAQSEGLAEVRIGTSGWHYQHWRGNFYPADLPPSKMLDYYVRHFDSVEINNSFYRLPKPGMFAAWRQATPAGFLFAVKASRFVTHNKKLKDPENALNNLLPRAAELGDRLGPILFQLPPRWRCNADRLAEMLAILPRELKYAFEFREPSWLCEDIFQILRRYNAAFCIFELAGYHAPLELTADWTYVRLHGPGGKYQGSYSDRKLGDWAGRIAEWSRALRHIYVYFDNDQAGYAARNALVLQRLVEARKAGRAA
jgi:uncharacterized protein YecE (DUF72 family)